MGATTSDAEPPQAEPDEVSLTLPADPTCAPVARVAVTAVGRRAGLAPTALARLALATDETLVTLLGAQHTCTTLTLRWHIGHGELAMSIAPGGGTVALTATDLQRLDDLVADLVDRWSIDADGIVHVAIGGSPGTD